MADSDYDAFISHAFEDKAEFVNSLASALRRYGLKIWYDDFELKVGDSLRTSIETGLAGSRYGIVVFSPKFLSKKKQWPKAELNALFQKEMDGHKVILPIWHKVSSKRMKSVLPIQADKKALRSSDGVEAVARSLVEVIRPDLFEIDVRQKSAFDAGESFIEEARRKYPGYDFIVYSGASAQKPSPAMELAEGSGKHRIEIRVADPSVVGPRGGKVTFFGTGVEKAIEFVRTGKMQKWEPGEFELEGWNVPLFPANSRGGTLHAGPQKQPSAAPRFMRVEIGKVVFPIMEMEPVRMGTLESEATISDKESPLSINVVFPFGSEARFDLSQKVDMSLSWEPTGKRASECQRMTEAIDALRSGSGLRIIDIRLERPIFEAAASAVPESDPFDPRFRRLVLLASQIEQAYAIPLRIPEVLSDEDHESLFHLDCLLNGREYGTAENSKMRIKKADGDLGEAQAAFLRGEWTVTNFAAPTDYPGYFPLFGQRVVTPPWVRAIEFLPLNPSADLEAFRNAPLGTELVVDIKAKGPIRLQWQDPNCAIEP
jgi:TIR domain